MLDKVKIWLDYMRCKYTVQNCVWQGVNSPYNTKNTLVANVINRNNNNLIKGVKF